MGKNKLIYDRIENLAKKHHCTAPQLALAWVLHQGNDVVPIPGECQNMFTFLKYVYGFRIMVLFYSI